MGLRIQRLALVAGLLAVGLFAASPFLAGRMLGTSEAYNYSLSVADAVTQMRAGILPPLAGQTVYAFNGRIHPLRDAPYLHYLAFALDTATGRRLPFWGLQTVSLALSITAAVFACCLGLRWGTGCGRLTALLLSALYGLSVPLLGAAYTLDMYMTVHAAVFVPLAVGACARGCRLPSFSADAWMAAALAAAWLAHPPVALWLTGGVILARGAAFVRGPSWRVLASGACALLLCACLASFVFVSTASLGSPVTGLSGGGGSQAMSSIILENVRQYFAGSLLPVSRGAGLPGGVQLGYVPWVLFLLTAAGFFRPEWRQGAGKGSVRSAAAGMTAAAALLLTLMVPLPGLTPFLWRHMPSVALDLTNIWPSQRLYLVALAFILFGAALVVPAAAAGLRLPRWALALAVLLGLSWTVFQATPFLSRGFGDRWTAEATRSAFRPSNIDLTITSYSFVLTPPSFVYGVADPETEFRLLRGGTDEIGSPIAAALATAPVADRGSLTFGGSAAVTLNPGRRYLLTFSFKRPREAGVLELKGPLLDRRYTLPTSGGARAFGMLPGQRRTLSVWTDGDRPERVKLAFFGAAPPPVAGRPPVFADYTLQEVDPDTLPIRFEGYLPLRLRVNAPELGCAVETSQRYLPGYEATVNGKKAEVFSSPDGQVMVPVPRGTSEVAVDYRGPASARAAFWLCGACWVAFMGWRLGGSPLPAQPLSPVKAAWRFTGNHRLATAVAAAAALAAALSIRHAPPAPFRRTAGPIEVDFTLPFGGGDRRNQPLLTTGRPGAAAIIYVTCLDGRHVRLGADVWGRLLQSAPIEVDFSNVQELVVSDSALFPKDDPRVAALDPAELADLRGELCVELNGRTEILAPCDAYETTPDEILAGRAPFGSLTIPTFLGKILDVRRLPIPRETALPWGRSLHMEVTFPEGRVGESEPLISGITGKSAHALVVTYLPDHRLRFTSWSPGTAPSESISMGYDPSRSHAIDLRAGEVDLALFPFSMPFTFDGEPVLGSADVHPADVPPLITSGVNSAHIPGVRERFTGAQLDLSVVPAPAAPAAAQTSGPVHLIVSLPLDKAGRSEPLLTTGRAGAGDFIFIRYADAGHVQIGLDHWGGPGALSGPIALDYRQPHEIWISTDSLYPVGQHAGRPVSVVFDGKQVLSSPVETYPSAPSEVSVARNLIGGSTEDAAFSGTVRFHERLGSSPVPIP